jgi:hypothetical protein
VPALVDPGEQYFFERLYIVVTSFLDY